MNLTRTDNGNYYSEDDPGEIHTGWHRLSVTDSDAEALARAFAGKTVLEIGTGLGVSTRAIASTAKHVYTCDADPWVAAHVAPTLPANVTFSVEPYAGGCDGAFLDGSHTYLSTLDDIAFARAHTRCEPLLIHDGYILDVARAIEASGVIVVEDYGPPCTMLRAVLALSGDEEAHRVQHGV
jgi:hypothetical protein